MLRRRPMAVTRRGPGLIGTMARTAVVAGTATAVAKGVSGAMDSGQQHAAQEQAAAADAAAQQQQIQDMQAQMAAMQAQQAQAAMQAQPAPAAMAAPAPAPPAAAPDLTTQLQQLAELHTSGILSDEEFAAAKAKLLSS